MGDCNYDEVAGNKEGDGKGGKIDGNGNEGGGQATAANMAMGMGMVQRTWLLVLQPEAVP
jgi:hypothetical protein